MEEKMIVYIEMETFVSNNCIDIKEIGAFESLIKENNVNSIFYGKRTARSKYNPIEGECFLFIIDSVFFVFTYQSRYGVYKSIEDYNNSLINGFDNALDYYFSKNEGIINYLEFKKYLKEYLIDDLDIKNYEKEHEYDEKTYYINFINILTEIENIRKQHTLTTIESIACYNLIKKLEKNCDYTIDLFDNSVSCLTSHAFFRL